MFGSLVNSDKHEPGDIDVLLCISKPLGADRWHKVTASDDIYIQGVQLSPDFNHEAQMVPPLKPYHGVEKMVQLFNERTIRTGENIEILTNECVELTI